MKKLQLKAAEVKSALVSKEAASTTTDTVIIILGTVVIATIVTVALVTILGDTDSGVVKNISDRFAGLSDDIEAAA